MKSWIRKIIIIFLISGGGMVAGSFYWHLSPAEFARHSIKLVATQVLDLAYQQDVEEAILLRQKFFHGHQVTALSNPESSWQEVERRIKGFHYLAQSNNPIIDTEIPFVFENMDAPYLVNFRDRYKLQEIVSLAASEYEAMLAVAAWLGTRWDHGVVYLSEEDKYDPVAILENAEKGTPYWCEIAAIVMVQAATSLGWPARLIAASRDGYSWEHGLAEIWSNQYGKWFVVDADFNIVYQANSEPLSAYELCHCGESFQRNGELEVKRFAPPKASLSLQNLLPYYEYVHIDLRNDWYSRKLRKGSPAGGDLATWWTARPGFDRLLTAKVRVDNKKKFDWPVNTVSIYAAEVFQNQENGVLAIQVALAGYAPYFRKFQVAMDGAEWESLDSYLLNWEVMVGKHCIKARVETGNQTPGPESSVCYQYLN